MAFPRGHQTLRTLLHNETFNQQLNSPYLLLKCNYIHTCAHFSTRCLSRTPPPFPVLDMTRATWVIDSEGRARLYLFAFPRTDALSFLSKQP